MSRPHTSYDQYDDIYDEKLWVSKEEHISLW